MKANRYHIIIEKIFSKYFQEGRREFLFSREDISSMARRHKIALPKNLGDVIYSFRYRNELPKSISEKAPEGFEWIIRPAGRSKYKFVAVPVSKILPSVHFMDVKIPNATPGIIDRYALNDEQALLAKLRYNRLIDIFTGISCYSLQNHLRTFIPHLGQVEIDELYVGIDKNGAQYIISVQAKGGSDKIGIVQIEQDIEVCSAKFPQLICRPLAAQFIGQDLICMFEFAKINSEIKIVQEKHYKLVEPHLLSNEDLQLYNQIASSKP